MTAGMAARKAFRRAVGCAAIGLALCCADNAYAAPTLSFEPSFSAGAHLGEAATLTAKLTFAGTEYFGHPEPLTNVTLRLPEGSILSNEGFPTCSVTTLEQKGPSGCPIGSVAGPAGSFTMFVSFGTETVQEQGTTETFFTEGGSLLLYLVGHSPVSIETLSPIHFEPASAPFGPAAHIAVPLIETVPGGHDASFTALTVGLGAFRGATGEETGSVTVPEGCPKGALSWRADTTFNDETTAHAEAETACPAAGTRAGTTTRLTASNVSPVPGEPVTYTATVAAKTPNLNTPSGVVRFLDRGALIAGCEAVTVVPGESSSTATCHTTPEGGVNTITAVYQGDLNFLRSEATGLTVTVSAGSGEEGKRKAEEEAIKKKAEEAAKKHQEEQAAAKKRQEEEAATKKQEQPLAPLLARRQTTRAISGTATVRLAGTSTFVPLSGSTSIPDGSEVDATNGRVVITVATPSGNTVSAEVYGGRFRVHQTSSGATLLILTLPLIGCPRVALPHGSAAVAKHSSGPKSRHLWVSETGGSWGTNGRYVSTTVQGTTWLTLDECTRSEVKIIAGKVKVLDLVRRKTRTIAAGHSYIAAARRGRHA